MIMGRHINKRQRRRVIYATLTILALILIIWHPWSVGSPQTPSSGTHNASGNSGNSGSPVPATPPVLTTTTTTGQRTGVGTPYYSDPPSSPESPATTVAPTTTTTTTTPLPTVDYGAAINPTFAQDPTNPLKVTYGYSASASIVQGGQFVPLASLPSGALKLFSDVNGQICSIPVGGAVVNGTCTTTYTSFGLHNIIANYVVNGSTYISPELVDNVQPFSTTIIANIKGGGSLGGLVFDANITDQNGNAVTAGAVTITMTDATEGWLYQETVDNVGADGADPGAFACLVVENYPKIGEYSGCGLSQQFTVTPQTGDSLTETVIFVGTLGWQSSNSSEITYTMP